MKNLLNVITIAAIAYGILLAEHAVVTWTGWHVIYAVIHCLLVISFAKRLWK